MKETVCGRKEGFYLHLGGAKPDINWQFACEYDFKVSGLYEGCSPNTDQIRYQSDHQIGHIESDTQYRTI